MKEQRAQRLFRSLTHIGDDLIQEAQPVKPQRTLWLGGSGRLSLPHRRRRPCRPVWQRGDQPGRCGDHHQPGQPEPTALPTQQRPAAAPAL